jgi:hypothetical protein
VTVAHPPAFTAKIPMLDWMRSVAAGNVSRAGRPQLAPSERDPRRSRAHARVA